MYRSFPSPRDEAGVTLVEVLIAASLGVVVLALAGTMFLTGILSQRNTTAVAVANSQAENVMSTFRNQIARAAEVPTITTSTGGTQTLITVAVHDYASSDTNNATERCVAWRLKDHAIQMTTYGLSAETKSQSDLTWHNLTTTVSGQDSTQVTDFTVSFDAVSATSTSTGSGTYPIQVSFSLTPMSSTGHKEDSVSFQNSFSPDSTAKISQPTSQCTLGG